MTPAITRIILTMAVVSTALVLAVRVLAAEPVNTAEPATQPAKQLIRHEFTHPALGTQFRIVVYCEDDAAIGRAEKAVISRLAQLDEIFDDTRPSSELFQVYANAGLGAVRVSNDLYGLLRQLEKLSVASRGGFELTAGASADLWLEAITSGQLPTAEQIKTAQALTGKDKLRLDPINRTVHLTETGMRLDLAEIIPGFACDRILSGLRAVGFRIALVDGGGRIAVGDPPPGRAAWTVRVNNSPLKSKLRKLPLVRQAVSSSGPAGDIIRLAGGDYSPLLDPATGVGSKNFRAVTVVAPRAWQADFLSRAAAARGPADGRKLLRGVANTRSWFHAMPDTPGDDEMTKSEAPAKPSNEITRPATEDNPAGPATRESDEDESPEGPSN